MQNTLADGFLLQHLAAGEDARKSAKCDNTARYCNGGRLLLPLPQVTGAAVPAFSYKFTEVGVK